MTDHEDESPWIETLAKAAGALGFSEVRVRWKLRSWARRRHQKELAADERATHVRYQHKTCPSCGAVNDRSETRCQRCEAKLLPRWVQVLGRLGFGVPSISVTHALGLAMVLVYARTMMVSPESDILSMDVRTLVAHGARAYAHYGLDEWWRWGTSMFLHIGLWHLGFNLFALSFIGPDVEDIYGRGVCLAAFLVTGLVASAGSDIIGGTSMAAGASGAVMGLIGLAAAWGHKQGTEHGIAVRNRMLMWLGYTFIFGLAIHADNWAHGFGFAAGAVFGYLVPTRAIAPTTGRVIAAVSAMACLALVVAALVGVGI